MEHRFGRAAPFALGMEEELLLLDPSGGLLAPVSSRLVPSVDPPAGTVMHDVYEALVETATDSGFQTARAQMFRGYPRADIPRAFAGWEDYAGAIDAVVAAAEVEDYTFFWWDLRPHPQLGTLEVRAMDAQARLGSVCGLAALVHGLVLAAAHEPAKAEPLPREVLVESSFRAGRDGLEASVWHDGALRPVREGNGADRMRAAYAEGGMPRVLQRLIAESAEPLGVPAPAA